MRRSAETGAGRVDGWMVGWDGQVGKWDCHAIRGLVHVAGIGKNAQNRPTGGNSSIRSRGLAHCQQPGWVGSLGTSSTLVLCRKCLFFPLLFQGGRGQCGLVARQPGLGGHAANVGTPWSPRVPGQNNLGTTGRYTTIVYYSHGVRGKRNLDCSSLRIARLLI